MFYDIWSNLHFFTFNQLKVLYIFRIMIWFVSLLTKCVIQADTQAWISVPRHSNRSRRPPSTWPQRFQGSFHSSGSIFSSRRALVFTGGARTWRAALTSRRSVGVCDKIEWERTYSPAPWLIFTVKDIRQCPTAHNANFWHIAVN